MKYALEDMPLLLSTSNRPSGISYVYLEPFTEIEKYYDMVKVFSDAGSISTCIPTAFPHGGKSAEARRGRAE